MLEVETRSMANAQGRKALLRNPLIPNPNLAIGEDEYMGDVPLVVFSEQRLKAQRPLTVNPSSLPYEKTAVKGAGDGLTEGDFVTNDFDIGTPFGGF